MGVDGGLGRFRGKGGRGGGGRKGGRRGRGRSDLGLDRRTFAFLYDNVPTGRYGDGEEERERLAGRRERGLEANRNVL